MWLSAKKLNNEQKKICEQTISSRAFFALVGDALNAGEGLSVVRMGDGEVAVMSHPESGFLTRIRQTEPTWDERLGIAGMPEREVQQSLIAAGNACTYFAPSVSGISNPHYNLYQYFSPRNVYVDNFFVNDWTPEMISILLKAAGGAFLLHKFHPTLAQNFAKMYGMAASDFPGFAKHSWKDNDEAVKAAIASGKKLILFSAGPAGKIIGPQIAKSNRVVLDIGNTLPGWSIGEPRAPRFID